MSTRHLAAGFLSVLSPLVPLAAQDVPPPQEPPARPPRRTEPVVVTATRSEKDPFDLPYSTTTLTGFDITTRLQSRTTPEALKEVAGVSVQKTSHGQGSPKIRGQTGFQTLLLVDGIRMNDSTWRTGNVEYWNHVDPYSYDRFEIVRGPSSVLWGSDAVSGVGHAFQKGRKSFEAGTHIDGLALFRYASAENSFIGRAETQGNVDGFGWHLGLSAKEFGDASQGRTVGQLPYSGYDEGDLDAKLTWAPDQHQRLSFGAQVVHLDDVPRTHSTIFGVAGWRGTTAGGDLERQHDHRRQLYWLQYEVEELSFADQMIATLGFKNRYEEENRLRSNGRRSFNELDVETPLATLQFTNQLGDGRLTWGGDWYMDLVDSSSREYNADGSLRSMTNRGVVAGDADYTMLGAFAQYDVPLGSEFDLLAGARYTHVEMDAKDVDVPGDSVTFNNVEEDWDAITGNVRLLWKAEERVRVFTGLSQSFRAPNLSDTTRFDVGRSGEQEVPASGLDEEQYLTFELGGRFDDGKLAVGLTGYYTDVKDQIGRFRTGNIINGLPEVSKSNVGDGYYAGFELEGSYDLADLGFEQWSLFGFVDYVDGRIDQLTTSGQIVEDKAGALPPLTGMLGVAWRDEEDRRGFEAYTRLAYHIHSEDYSTADGQNPERIPPDGLPGYAVVGLRGWVEVCPKVLASLAVENLADLDYRIMDSGMNELGTNVMLTLQAKF